MEWGLMAQAGVGDYKRVRSLGLTKTVRYFNELAIPGIGNISFGKQLLWSLLGIYLHEIYKQHLASESKIQIANGIEALACFIALSSKDENDKNKLLGRVLGSTKLQKPLQEKKLQFKDTASTKYYVTQPMRMRTLDALRNLGFVKENCTSRFNSFECSDVGINFIKISKTACEKELLEWVCGKTYIIPKKGKNDFSNALNPLISLSSETKSILVEKIRENDIRSHLWEFIGGIEGNIEVTLTDLEPLPNFNALKAGILFFKLRADALYLLIEIEKLLSKKTERKDAIIALLRSKGVNEALATLQISANDFSRDTYTDISLDLQEAKTFAHECKNEDKEKVVQALIRRDGKILCLNGDYVEAGPLFITRVDDYEGEEENEIGTQENTDIVWPDYISERVKSFYSLYKDLK